MLRRTFGGDVCATHRRRERARRSVDLRSSGPQGNRDRVVWANLTARTAAAANRSQQHVFYRGAGGLGDRAHLLGCGDEGLYRESWTAKRTRRRPPAIRRRCLAESAARLLSRRRGRDRAHFWDGATSRLYRASWTPKPQCRAPRRRGTRRRWCGRTSSTSSIGAATGAVNHIFWDSPANRSTSISGSPVRRSRGRAVPPPAIRRRWRGRISSTSSIEVTTAPSITSSRTRRPIVCSSISGGRTRRCIPAPRAAR